MRDLWTDWRRWTTVERMFAVTLVALAAMGVPLLLVLNGAAT